MTKKSKAFLDKIKTIQISTPKSIGPKPKEYKLTSVELGAISCEGCGIKMPCAKVTFSQDEPQRTSEEQSFAA